jgi:hypothetical protein
VSLLVVQQMSGYVSRIVRPMGPAKSLIRMFGPRGNPQAKNLFAVIGYLQKKAGLHLRVAA